MILCFVWPQEVGATVTVIMISTALEHTTIIGAVVVVVLTVT